MAAVPGTNPNPNPAPVIIQKTRTVELPGGRGKITYRIPNVVEQLRFQSAAKWYDQELSKDGSLRLSYAIEAMGPWIVSIEGAYNNFDEIMADRANTNVLMDIALDLAGKHVPEDEKKH